MSVHARVLRPPGARNGGSLAGSVSSGPPFLGPSPPSRMNLSTLPHRGAPSRAFAPLPALRHVASLALALALPVLAPRAQDAAARPGAATQPIPAPLAAALPELADQSAWEQDARYEGENPDKSRRGVYPIGNGRLFAYAGLGARANSLQGLTGPGYQTDETNAPRGHFGGLSLLLRSTAGEEEQEVALTEQRVRRVRGAGFVVSEDAAAGGLALRTLTFAPPGQDLLVRVVEIVNQGRAASGAMQLVLRLDDRNATIPVVARSEEAVLRIAYPSTTRPRAAAIWLSAPEASARGEAIYAPVPALEAGRSWSAVVTVTAKRGGIAEAQPTILDQDGATLAARTTSAWWKERLAKTLYTDTDHRKLRDLLEDWKVLMLVQRDEASGVVAPMVNYRGYWVRDSVGPMLAFLRWNLWDEAKALLTYLFDAVRLLDRVPNHVPLDLDFAPLQGKVTDWAALDVPESEIPAWVILLHTWYWRVTQDTDLIEKHWPLLDACLKKQRRFTDDLMTFQGDETFLHGAFSSLYPDRVGDPAFLLADDRSQGRRAWSFSSGVMFLISMHGMGELVDALDRKQNPGKWAAGAPDKKPSQAYVERTFRILQALEKRYWQDDLGYFAPALSPLTGEPHRTPFADVNLMPLWIGWTFPTGEKSRDNLRNSLARLTTGPAQIGMTPTVAHTTGLTHAMLLTALCERDGKERLAVFDELLRRAGPAGEWGELYDPEGRPMAAYDRQWPNRCRPWESGVCLEAIYFALTGMRYLTVPNWDNTDIRAKLRMPNGASFVTLRGLKKDARHLDLFYRETFAKLSEQERKDNEEKKPEDRRDPVKLHRRVNWRLELHSGMPPRGYYDVGVNAMGTMFVRYFTPDIKVIDETEFWKEDTEAFLRPADAEVPALAWSSPKRTEGAELLFLGNRNAGAELIGKDGVTLVDTGLPMETSTLRALLLGADGKPTHPRLFLDRGWNAAGPSTFRAATTLAGWDALVQAYAQAGGKVLAPGFATRFTVQAAGKDPVEAGAPQGVLQVAGEGEVTVRVRFTAKAGGDAVLRMGSAAGVSVKWNGEQAFQRGPQRLSLPDQDAVLVRLREGVNEAEVVLQGKGERTFAVRVSDSRGLPIEGVTSE